MLTSVFKKKSFPFVTMAFFWSMLCVLLGALIDQASVPYVLLLLLLCCLNLFLLTKVVAMLLRIMSEKKQQKQILEGIQLSFWALLKLACLGALVFAVYENTSMPVVLKILSCSTLVVVPICGGFVWSLIQQEI